MVSIYGSIGSTQFHLGFVRRGDERSAIVDATGRGYTGCFTSDLDIPTARVPQARR